MAGVPVLLYHGFGDEPSRYIVSRRAFEMQMRLLSLLRIRVVSVAELAEALRSGRRPRRTVALTIDDGYAEVGDMVEVLDRYGFGATVFLVSETLGGVNDWSHDEQLRGRKILTVEEARSLREHGVELGAHSRSHRELPGLDDAELVEEITSSRRKLERILGEPISSFAYPYGCFDERVVDAVRAAGFASACTVARRPARLDDDPLLLPRVEIRRSDSLSRFFLEVALAGV